MATKKEDPGLSEAARQALKRRNYYPKGVLTPEFIASAEEAARQDAETSAQGVGLIHGNEPHIASWTWGGDPSDRQTAYRPSLAGAIGAVVEEIIRATEYVQETPTPAQVAGWLAKPEEILFEWKIEWAAGEGRRES